MPTFPTYHGPPLPEILNPLDPRDYWLLLTWIYFQPSRLKHYLHRADPDLYRATGWASLRRSLRLLAYRNLYVMSLVLTVLLSIFFSVSVAWASSAAQGRLVDWGGLAVGVVYGVASGVICGVASGLAIGLARGMAVGVAIGVAVGVAFGVAFGLVGGMVGGTSVSMTVVEAFLMAFGMTLGVTLSAALGAAFGVAGGVIGGVAVGVVFGSLFGWYVGYEIGRVFGTSIDKVIGPIFGAFVNPSSESIGTIFGIAGGVVTVGAGGCRLFFYVFEAPLAWWLSRSSSGPFLHLERHPVMWDELAVLPLPGVDRLLRACLLADLERGLIFTAWIAANPFQRWAAQRALSDFIADQPRPLVALYKLAHLPTLHDYLFPPLVEHQFRDLPSVHEALLGEIGQTFVDGTGGGSETSEHFVWQLTRRLRRMEATPLSQFSLMLYELFRDENELETLEIQEIKLAERFASAYEGVRPFPHGDEIAGSFAALAAFLEAQDAEAVAQAPQKLEWINSLAQPPLRPIVVEALKALGDVSAEAAAYMRATNNAQKSAALNRAAGALNELAGYIEKEVKPPERVLLKRVVGLWQSIVAAEQGKLGEAALREMTPAARRATGTAVERTSAVWQRPLTAFDNPYVVGNPVAPPLFVGRTDIFNRVGEVWSAKSVPDSIILYGHRRMGKSSILRNLNQALQTESVIVYADMAGETSFVESTPDLLLGLADKIYTALQPLASAKEITRPDQAAYNGLSSAAREFNRFTEQARSALDGQALILALDEFEAVERAVEAGKIGKEIYAFLRAKTQEPWITLVLGGLHTLDEMSRDYQQPFYGSYENIRVSYLAHADAWRLITNPTEDFVLNYEPEAVERIIAETGGQPYLVQ